MNGRTEAEDMEREYQRQSLRDTFAAAALTGLLEKHDAASPDQIAAWWPETACAAAYRWADAMLRERAKTNHDAAPAARATNSSSASGTSGDSSPVTKPSSGTGDTKPMPDAAAGSGFVTAEPVAWAVASIANNDLRTFHKSREDAEGQIAEVVRQGIVRYADTMRVVPLYRQPQPTLTDAEREAVENAADLIDNKTCGDSSTLRGLLERLA